MENITEERDSDVVVLPFAVRQEEAQDISVEAEHEPAENLYNVRAVVSSIIDQTRDFVMKRGLAGLLIYNGVRSGAVGAAVGFIYEGSTFDRVAVGAAAGGLNLITSQTFWAAMAIAGAKVGSKVFSGKRRFKVVS